MFPVLVTHIISEPGVAEYARGEGISIFYSSNCRVKNKNFGGKNSVK